MGLNIKNDEVERLVRDYAKHTSLGITDAIAQAVRIARQTQRVEDAENIRKTAIQQFFDIADQGWHSDDARWNREDLHERNG